MKTLKYFIFFVLSISLGFSKNIDFSGEIRNKTNGKIKLEYAEKTIEIGRGCDYLIEEKIY